ncbi:hypothetical protein [Neorhizobium tomejilense]|uniref:hypothetical protein n=1 Tax=Neorhizobium tomejilense TaxID=2093828 RepID=UPI000CF8C7B4|nr:hypothetical protein [Neorhizobium tomejilense]
MDTVSPKPEPERRASVLRVLKSDGFLEKVMLLVLTAVLSGFLIPWAVKSIDRDREAREAISSAQVKLFDEVSATIVTLETLMLDVTWFGTINGKNSELQKKAFERYSEQSSALVIKLRTQSSRAQTLASPQMATELEAFLLRFFVEQDTPINQLWARCASDCDWEQQHRRNLSMLSEANQLVGSLAKDVALTRP